MKCVKCVIICITPPLTAMTHGESFLFRPVTKNTYLKDKLLLIVCFLSNWFQKIMTPKSWTWTILPWALSSSFGYTSMLKFVCCKLHFCVHWTIDHWFSKWGVQKIGVKTTPTLTLNITPTPVLNLTPTLTPRSERGFPTLSLWWVAQH